MLAVWYTTDGGSFCQIIGADIVVLRQQLAGGGTESTEGAEKIGTTGEYFGKGGSR